MTNRVHTILCWILAISLVWLPLSASADIPLVSTEKDSCHEMNSVLQDQTVNNSAMNASMLQKDYCDCCENSCVACTGPSSCCHSPNNASPFILFNQYAFQSLPLMQSSIEQFAQYYNQIITPDIRPPVV
jgi:hypothetical protein